MPQLHTYVEHRLACWVIWLHWGSSGKPAGVVSWYDKMVMAPNVQGRGGDTQPCPVDEADAYDTNLAVGALADHLRAAIVAHWRWAGTAEMKARDLGISRDQFYTRIATANGKILGYLQDIEAGIALPKPEPVHGNVKQRRKKPLHLPDTFRTFRARLA